MSSLIGKTVKASLWSTVTELIAKVVSPAVFLVLTSILSPRDFAVVAVATTLYSLCMIVSDLGTSKVLVQHAGNSGRDINELYNVAFTINLIIGLVLAAGLTVGSDALAAMYKSPESSGVIKAMALQIVFYALSSVQNAIRQKQLDFKFLFYTRLITIGAPVLVSIPIALLGGGYWSIVAGTVAGSFLSMVALWVSSRWKPRLLLRREPVVFLVSKSIWNTVYQLVIWCPMFLDTYLLANYLTETDLGFYTTSRTLFTAVSSLIIMPILPVLFSTLAKVQDDDAYYHKLLLSSHKTLYTLCGLAGVVVFAFRGTIEAVLFNDQWHGIADCLGLLFILYGFHYFEATALEGLRARGYFKEIAVNNTLSVLVSVVLLWWSVDYGLYAYTVVRGLCLFLAFPGTFYCSRKYCGLSFAAYFNDSRRITIYMTAYLLAAVAMQASGMAGWLQIALLVLMTAAMCALLYKENGEVIRTIVDKLIHR